jgi:hypothetical protein
MQKKERSVKLFYKQKNKDDIQLLIHHGEFPKDMVTTSVRTPRITAWGSPCGRSY